MSNPKPTDLWVLEEEERWKESKERLHKSLKEIEDKARHDAIKEFSKVVLDSADDNGNLVIIRLLNYCDKELSKK